MPETEVYQPPECDRCGESTCEGCAPECDRCDTRSDDLLSTVDGESICERCATGWSQCDHCGDLAESSDELRVTDGESVVCSVCARRYYECDNCTTLITSGDYCSECEDDGECHCGCCGGDTVEGLLDYGYKPMPEFHGKGPVYLGLELELETSDRDELEQCVFDATDALGDLAYLKEDSSLNRGFEIVTHPMSHEYAAESFPWGLLSRLRADGADPEDAGLHVHVSRAGFDGPAHVYRWLKLLYRNETGVTTIARRDSRQWAPFRPEDRQEIKKYAKNDRDCYTSRYAAVNVTNYATFELRVFASSLQVQEVRAALDLAAASVEYTRSLTVADIVRRGGWEWSAFGTWVASHDEYAALTAEMGMPCAS